MKSYSLILAGGMALAISTVSQAATTVEVTIRTSGNVAIAPALVSFHNGSYDLFNEGDDARTISGLETLAEDGGTGGIAVASGVDFQSTTGPISSAFTPTPPPTSRTLTIDVSAGNTFFSIAAMVLASNDWFVANDNAQLFDLSTLLSSGIGATQTISLNEVYDAGTELEDFNFSPGNPLLGLTGGQSAPGEGTEQAGGLISEVTDNDPFSVFDNTPAGFNSTDFDFNAPGAGLLEIDFRVVPEPSTALLLGFGALGLMRRKRA